MRLSSAHKFRRGQTAMEYLLLLAMGALIVMLSFQFLIPRIRVSSNQYFSTITQAIMGSHYKDEGKTFVRDNPTPINGGWCPVQCPPDGTCGNPIRYSACQCPAPAFGGKDCTGTFSKDQFLAAGLSASTTDEALSFMISKNWIKVSGSGYAITAPNLFTITCGKYNKPNPPHYCTGGLAGKYLKKPSDLSAPENADYWKLASVLGGSTGGRMICPGIQLCGWPTGDDPYVSCDPNDYDAGGHGTIACNAPDRCGESQPGTDKCGDFCQKPAFPCDCTGDMNGTKCPGAQPVNIPPDTPWRAVDVCDTDDPTCQFICDRRYAELDRSNGLCIANQCLGDRPPGFDCSTITFIPGGATTAVPIPGGSAWKLVTSCDGGPCEIVQCDPRSSQIDPATNTCVPLGQCVGGIASGASPCTTDVNIPIPAGATWTSVSACDGVTKCQYLCPSGSLPNGSACSAQPKCKDIAVDGNGNPTAAFCSGSDVLALRDSTVVTYVNAGLCNASVKCQASCLSGYANINGHTSPDGTTYPSVCSPMCIGSEYDSQSGKKAGCPGAWPPNSPGPVMETYVAGYSYCGSGVPCQYYCFKGATTSLIKVALYTNSSQNNCNDKNISCNCPTSEIPDPPACGTYDIPADQADCSLTTWGTNDYDPSKIATEARANLDIYAGRARKVARGVEFTSKPDSSHYCSYQVYDYYEIVTCQ